jgi:hypothetical protein
MIPPVYSKKIFFSVPGRQTCSVRVTSPKTSLAADLAPDGKRIAALMAIETPKAQKTQST